MPPASFPREKTKLLEEKTKLPGEKTKLTGEKTKFARGNKHGGLGPDSIFLDLESYVKFGPYSEESIYLYHLHYFLPMFSSEPKHSGLIMYPGILEAHT